MENDDFDSDQDCTPPDILDIATKMTHDLLPDKSRKLIILLALLIGVLYCLHLLVKDYQAITNPGRLLRFLTKRDLISRHYSKPSVRWRKILQFDPLQCARALYCDIGARPPDTAGAVRRGFTFMLKLEPREEDRTGHEEFVKAYNVGRLGKDSCRKMYPMCPFEGSVLFELVQYLLNNPFPLLYESTDNN